MSTDEAPWTDVLDEVDELIDGDPDTPVWDALVAAEDVHRRGGYGVHRG